MVFLNGLQAITPQHMLDNKSSVMKKSIQHIITMIVILSFSSCIKDEDLAIPATIHSSEEINITVNGLSVFDERNIDPENTDTFQTTITATLSEAKTVDAIIDITQISGNADEDDFSFDSTIIIEAGQTSASSVLEVYRTQDPEGTETFTLSASSRANFSIDFEQTFSIENDYINDVLNLSISWDNTYTYNDNGSIITLEACNEIDLDVYLYDLDYNYVATIAESADCPELGSISNLDDGNYMIGVYLYDSYLASYGLNQTLPLTITYSQDGFIEETSFVNNEFNTDDTWDLYKEVIVAEIEVRDGYMYTITPN